MNFLKRIFRKKATLVGVCYICNDCGCGTYWSFKDMIKRDKDQDVVYCEKCGSGADIPKKNMIKAFVSSWIETKAR